MLDSGMIMSGEITFQSLLGVTGLSAQTRSMLTRYHESKGENRIPQEEHKDVFQEPVWSFYYGGTVKFILKKMSICSATK